MKRLLILTSLCLSLQAKHTTTTNLYHQSVSWLRDYLVSSAADIDNKGSASQQYLVALEQLGRSFECYYGKTRTEELTKLFIKQGKLTLDLIDSAKKDDKDIYDKAHKALKINALHIAALLSKTNAYLDFEPLRDLMNEQNRLASAMTASRLKGDWSTDTEQYQTLLRSTGILAHMIDSSLDDAFPECRKKRPEKSRLPLPAGTHLPKN